MTVREVKLPQPEAWQETERKESREEQHVKARAAAFQLRPDKVVSRNGRPPERNKPHLSAVLVTYNSAQTIAEAVESLEGTLSHLDAEVFVVDNASRDKTVDVARRVLRRGQVLALSGNVGYGRAVNIALAEASGESFLIMNDDARLQQGCIERLVEVLNGAEDVALVGPRIVGKDGTPAPSARYAYPGWRDEWERIRNLLPVNRRLDYPHVDTPHEVAWLVGACLLAKTEILRMVGGFNPAFFLYGEDIDLGRRLRALKLRSVTVPDTLCIHGQGTAITRAYSSSERNLRQMRGRDTYYRIWHTRPSRMLLNLSRALGVEGLRARIRFYLPKVIYDGPSLRNLRFPTLHPDPIQRQSERR